MLLVEVELRAKVLDGILVESSVVAFTGHEQGQRDISQNLLDMRPDLIARLREFKTAVEELQAGGQAFRADELRFAVQYQFEVASVEARQDLRLELFGFFADPPLFGGDDLLLSVKKSVIVRESLVELQADLAADGLQFPPVLFVALLDLDGTVGRHLAHVIGVKARVENADDEIDPGRQAVHFEHAWQELVIVRQVEDLQHEDHRLQLSRAALLGDGAEDALEDGQKPVHENVEGLPAFVELVLQAADDFPESAQANDPSQRLIFVRQMLLDLFEHDVEVTVLVVGLGQIEQHVLELGVDLLVLQLSDGDLHGGDDARTDVIFVGFGDFWCHLSFQIARILWNVLLVGLGHRSRNPILIDGLLEQAHGAKDDIGSV